MPPVGLLVRHPTGIIPTLKQGYPYLFTDNGLDLLFNIDLFVLGLFIDARDMGTYAQAAILARCFLIIPLAVKPILKRRYTLLSESPDPGFLEYSLVRNAVVLFSMHSLLAVFALLHYPAILGVLLKLRSTALVSFSIFCVIIPGLIFYAVFSAQETFYEALGQAAKLKRMNLILAGMNLVLTFYLVPLAGPHGAAAATMITMLTHFFLFGRRLPQTRMISKTTFIVSGLAVYLVYMILKHLAWGLAVNIWLIPLMLGTLFYLCGLFNTVGELALPVCIPSSLSK